MASGAGGLARGLTAGFAAGGEINKRELAARQLRSGEKLAGAKLGLGMMKMQRENAKEISAAANARIKQFGVEIQGLVGNNQSAAALKFIKSFEDSGQFDLLAKQVGSGVSGQQLANGLRRIAGGTPTPQSQAAATLLKVSALQKDRLTDEAGFTVKAPGLSRDEALQAVGGRVAPTAPGAVMNFRDALTGQEISLRNDDPRVNALLADPGRYVRIGLRTVTGSQEQVFGGPQPQSTAAKEALRESIARGEENIVEIGIVLGQMKELGRRAAGIPSAIADKLGGLIQSLAPKVIADAAGEFLQTEEIQSLRTNMRALIGRFVPVITADESGRYSDRDMQLAEAANAARVVNSVEQMRAAVSSLRDITLRGLKADRMKRDDVPNLHLGSNIKAYAKTLRKRFPDRFASLSEDEMLNEVVSIAINTYGVRVRDIVLDE